MKKDQYQIKIIAETTRGDQIAYLWTIPLNKAMYYIKLVQQDQLTKIILEINVIKQ